MQHKWDRHRNRRPVQTTVFSNARHLCIPQPRYSPRVEGRIPEREPFPLTQAGCFSTLRSNRASQSVPLVQILATVSFSGGSDSSIRPGRFGDLVEVVSSRLTWSSLWIPAEILVNPRGCPRVFSFESLNRPGFARPVVAEALVLQSMVTLGVVRGKCCRRPGRYGSRGSGGLL